MFISAPESLKGSINEEKHTFSVNDGLKVIARLNDDYRTLYTKKIVGDGKKSGLKFDEKWLNNEVEAGPLPALFLRSTSSFLEKSTVPLGLYLGSDFPISQSNLLTGIQAEKFKEIRKDSLPKFFFNPATKRHIAMFADYASADACVSCHNNHESSPKKDWKLNDIMGVTTWSFPHDSLTTNELIELINVYNHSALSTYSAYLDKTKTFEDSKKPIIGEKWPNAGYYLPSLQKFSDTILSNTSLYLIKNFIDENI